MKHNLSNVPVKSTPQQYERFFKGMKAELEAMLKNPAYTHYASTSNVLRVILGTAIPVCHCGHDETEHTIDGCTKEKCFCKSFKTYGFRTVKK